MRYPTEAWYEAASLGDAASVDEMLRDATPEELDELDENGENALLASAKAGYYFAVSRLLDAGANPKVTDAEGRSAVDLAMENDAPSEVVDILVGAGSPSGGVDLDEIEMELDDGGYEEESDSYLMEAKLSKPSEAAYSKAVSAENISLCESRMGCNGEQILEFRIPGAKTFQEAVTIFADAFAGDVVNEPGEDDDFEEEPEPFDDDDEQRCSRCGNPVYGDSSPLFGVCGDCYEKENGNLECAQCHAPVESADYGTYGGLCESCAHKSARG